MTLAAVLRHLAFAGALALLSAAVVRGMIALRMLDRPDERKAHTLDTPKGGGVGVVVAFLAGVAMLYRFAEFSRLADPYFIGVIEASVAIAVVAFLDDLFDWAFTVKLCAQVLAALVASSHRSGSSVPRLQHSASSATSRLGCARCWNGTAPRTVATTSR